MENKTLAEEGRKCWRHISENTRLKIEVERLVQEVRKINEENKRITFEN